MSRQILYRLLLFSVVLFGGCELDNYDPPASPLTGRLVFDGQPVEILQGINVLQLFQPGYENKNPIPVRVMQDGSFSSMLFDGSYQLVRIAGNGPWDHRPDTIMVDVRGATTVDVPVTPYFSVSDAEFSVANGVLTASCRVTNNVAGRQLESVVLLVGKRTLVDHIYRLTPADPGSNKPGAQVDLADRVVLTQSLEGDPFASEPHLFARIGVKAVGHPEYVYSPVWKVVR